MGYVEILIYLKNIDFYWRYFKTNVTTSVLEISHSCLNMVSCPELNWDTGEEGRIGLESKAGQQRREVMWVDD